MGNTALHIAIVAFKGDTSMVELLLQHGADKNIPNADGKTPLEVVRKLGFDALLPALLEKRSKKKKKANIDDSEFIGEI